MDKDEESLRVLMQKLDCTICATGCTLDGGTKNYQELLDRRNKEILQWHKEQRKSWAREIVPEKLNLIPKWDITSDAAENENMITDAYNSCRLEMLKAIDRIEKLESAGQERKEEKKESMRDILCRLNNGQITVSQAEEEIRENSLALLTALCSICSSCNNCDHIKKVLENL